nr:unnamed protein product [Callosobruchus analis]
MQKANFWITLASTDGEFETEKALSEMFTTVVVFWPGSFHDARIWSTSEIQQIIRRNRGRALLLGDAGFGVAPWLMTEHLTVQCSKYSTTCLTEKELSSSAVQEYVIVDTQPALLIVSKYSGAMRRHCSLLTCTVSSETRKKRYVHPELLLDTSVIYTQITSQKKETCIEGNALEAMEEEALGRGIQKGEDTESNPSNS